MAHAFAEENDIEVREGKPFDPGNDDGETGGFTCFDNVVMHKGKIAEFMHGGGEGPCCTITKTKDHDLL